MNFRRLVLFLAVTLPLFACGCMSNRVASFTVLSTKNVPCQFQAKGASKGADVMRMYVFFPDKATPNIMDAMDDAIEQRGGAAIENCSIDQYFWLVTILYAEAGFTVQGDVVSTRDRQATSH